MPSQEEQESQIEATLHGLDTDLESPPRLPPLLANVKHLAHEQHRRNSKEPGSDDTIPDPDVTATIHSDGQQDSIRSVVEDTQFVGVENDTQATDAFDNASPNTRRVIAMIKSHPPPVQLPVLPSTFREIQKPVIVEVTREFTYGPAPKNSVKYTRPIPGQTTAASRREISEDDEVALLPVEAEPASIGK
jgi:hypothetical protein